MAAKQSVDQMIIKARSHEKKDEIADAKKLYQAVLLNFPMNKRAQDGLAALNKSQQKKTIINPPQESLNQLADLYNQGEFQAVIKQALILIEQYPQSFVIWNLLGAAATQTGMLDQAVNAYKKAILIKPDYAEAYCNLGIVLQKQNKLDEAIKVYNKAILINTSYVDAHTNLGFALLNSGRLKEGLDKYEWRWKTPSFLSNVRQFSQPMWDGKENLNDKTILIWHEQGIADTIIWSSILPFITSQTKHCILECQEKLVPLLKRSFPDVEVKAENRSSDTLRDDFDFHLPMGSLYKNFVLELEKNSKGNAYLVPDQKRVEFWKDRLKSLGNGPYIGISWKSANMSSSRLQNYANICELSPILTIPNVTFINLQYSDFTDDLAKVKDELGITVHNFEDLDHFNNIDDVAALCAALDMVVSTQSTVPLISAGVGTSTKLASWKQSSWNNVLMNPTGPLVDKFERDTSETWENIFNLIAEDILKITTVKKPKQNDIKKNQLDTH